MKNTKIIFSSHPIFSHIKSHYCPKCNNELFLIDVSKVVNSKSEEAKDYDFSFVDNYLHGDVEFIWEEFKCDNCDFQMSINDLYKLEKDKRKQAKKLRRKDK